MKKGLSRLTFSETTRRIITIAIYAFFTIYTLYKLLQEPSPEGKICYGLLLIDQYFYELRRIVPL